MASKKRRKKRRQAEPEPPPTPAPKAAETPPPSRGPGSKVDLGELLAEEERRPGGAPQEPPPPDETPQPPAEKAAEAPGPVPSEPPPELALEKKPQTHAEPSEETLMAERYERRQDDQTGEPEGQGLFARLGRWWRGLAASPDEPAVVSAPTPAPTLPPRVAKAEAPPARSGPSAAERELKEEVEQLHKQLQGKEHELEGLRRDLSIVQGRLAEQQASEERIRKLEEELEDSRTEIEGLGWQLGEKVRRLRDLEEELDAAQAGTATPAATDARVQRLESELEQVRADLQAARLSLADQMSGAPAPAEPAEEIDQAAEKRLVEAVEAEKEELARILETTEKELKELRESSAQDLERARQETKNALNQVRDLESALQQASARAQEVQAEMLGHKNTADTLQAELAEQKNRIDELQEKLSATESTKAGKEAARAGEMRKALAAAEKQAEQLQAELADQKSQVQALQEQLARVPPAGAAARAGEGTPLSSGQAEELYRQALTPITVLLASADLVALSAERDPSLNETARELKIQGQALLDLIKSYTQPPESE